MLPLIKICGITSFEDAKAAIEAGADWLGFIFVPESPRAVSLESAASFLQQLKQDFPKIRLIGVFKDSSPEEVRYHCEHLPLDAVQLHGDENPDEFASFNAPIIKVLLLDPKPGIVNLQSQADVWLQNANVETLLLDLPKGSGLSSILEWPAFGELKEWTDRFPCIVAGGLKPDNVAQVIDALHPRGVDVASGVEQSSGKKDVARMQGFCQAVKSFKSDTESGESIPCNR